MGEGGVWPVASVALRRSGGQEMLQPHQWCKQWVWLQEAAVTRNVGNGEVSVRMMCGPSGRHSFNAWELWPLRGEDASWQAWVFKCVGLETGMLERDGVSRLLPTWENSSNSNSWTYDRWFISELHELKQSTNQKCIECCAPAERGIGVDFDSSPTTELDCTCQSSRQLMSLLHLLQKIKKLCKLLFRSSFFSESTRFIFIISECL